MKRAKDDPAAGAIAERAKAEVRELKTELDRLEGELTEAGAKFEAAMLQLPNLPHPSSPLGDREEDAEVVKVVGEQPQFGFEPRDHLAIAGRWIDMERGARTSGSRFPYLMGDVAVLWMALSRYAIDVLRGKGLIPVNPPVLVRREALVGTGFLPGDEAQIYRVPEDELYLVGTSEVSLAALHLGEILPEEDLPAAVLRHLHVLPARGRRGGPRHARHLPHAPVREGGDVLVLPPGQVLGGARLAARDRGGDRAGARLPLPRRQRRGRRSRQPGREEVRHRGVAGRPGRATAS